MLKYVDTKVVFQEVPDEITLAINISNCPCRCKNCHSPYLSEDIGIALTIKKVNQLIEDNKGISCICFMGGDAEPEEINTIAKILKHTHKELKIAWYSGRQELNKEIDLRNFNYIKLGPYIEDLGPLTSKTTNQRFYHVQKCVDIDGDKMSMHCSLIDDTHKFWKNDK
jgi:anaerobic ribonucleoside-triphosphate reductase activating protein